MPGLEVPIRERLGIVCAAISAIRLHRFGLGQFQVRV